MSASAVPHRRKNRRNIVVFTGSGRPNDTKVSRMLASSASGTWTWHSNLRWFGGGMYVADTGFCMGSIWAVGDVRIVVMVAMAPDLLSGWVTPSSCWFYTAWRPVLHKCGPFQVIQHEVDAGGVTVPVHTYKKAGHMSLDSLNPVYVLLWVRVPPEEELLKGLSLTGALYSLSLTEIALILRQRLRKPRILFARYILYARPSSVCYLAHCCSVPQLNTLRATQYVHPHPYMYEYRYTALGEDCMCDRFQLPRHVGSHTLSSEGFISLSGEWGLLCQELTMACVYGCIRTYVH